MPRSPDPPAAGGARPRDFLPILGSVVVWGLTPVLITLLGRARFDSYTQNAFRDLVAAAFFLCLGALRDGRALGVSAWDR